jgi:hypothetical protein
MAFSLSFDKTKTLEREFREETNFANSVGFIRAIRPFA